MHDHFKMFAQYNAWANRLLHKVAGDLPDEDYRRDCQVAFTSMHGTLNHLLVGDMIWMNRFTGDGTAPTRLDEVVHDDIVDLENARTRMDGWIIDWVDSLSANALDREFTYVPITLPEPVTQQLAPALAHFFNHQTHHRGQAHAMLTRLTGEAPSLDLLYYQREMESGPV